MLLRRTSGALGAATLPILLAQPMLARPVTPLPDARKVADIIPVPCVGDCNGDGRVTVDEILTLVNIDLGNVEVSACPPPGDICPPDTICIDVLEAVNNALSGCPSSPTPTATLTPTAVSLQTPTTTP